MTLADAARKAFRSLWHLIREVFLSLVILFAISAATLAFDYFMPDVLPGWLRLIALIVFAAPLPVAIAYGLFTIVQMLLDRVAPPPEAPNLSDVSDAAQDALEQRLREELGRD